ncbi:MAG: DUF3160 domain-containing protein [Elusimicrobia bacterium]|nr:DUF3160 domain-containing protein [Elusimicrobiota bacterium]
MFSRKTVSAVLLLCLISQTAFSLNPFDSFREITVLKSPEASSSITFEKKQVIQDFDVLANNSAATAILKDSNKKTWLVLWKYKTGTETLDLKAPQDITFEEIVSHPQDPKVFLLGKDSKGASRIFSYDITLKNITEIYSDTYSISNLTMSSSKFSDKFRLFFTRKKENSSEIATITDTGQRFYPVLSETDSYSANWTKETPNILMSSFGVPITFNPMGNVLLWYNKDNDIFALPYKETNWGNIFVPEFALGMGKAENIVFSPNGMYMLHWSANEKDLKLLNNYSSQEQKILSFDSKAPSKIRFTSDGKGIVYVRNNSELVYTPLNLPLYDVENAWMFCTDENDTQLFMKNGGLFRPTNNEQIYFLYDSENFDPSGKYYNAQLPSRPYLVTTDPFYEILEAAYSGIFYLNEKSVSLKRFTQFVREATKVFSAKKSESSEDAFWAKLFVSASKILEGKYDSEELLRVKNCDGIADSKILQRDNVNFIEFKTRGYYDQDDAMTGYFKAVQYLSIARPTTKQWTNFQNKITVNPLLKQWINSYKPFVPPSNQVLPGLKADLLSYVKHKQYKTALVPRAWGIDSEILNSLVYHADWPSEDQVMDENGGLRSVPDIYELGYIFGSNLAKKILETNGIYTKYPNLNKIHENLIKRWKRFNTEGVSGIYNKWLSLISLQMTGKKPDWPWLTEDLWQAKQLQTGLSGWTNLRHATYIFNEMEIGLPESGDGGFELMTRKPPRGAVEPFPEAFGALIAMCSELKNVCSQIPRESLSVVEKSGTNTALKDGILKHIDNVIKNMEVFKRIAEKQKNNITFSNEEYNMILACARVIERDFLVFKSICTREFGLAVPKAVPKCVDVYGDANTGMLHSCIGFPLEWDLIIPYFGRREIVKGTSYLSNSFAVSGPVTDDEWYEENKLKPKYPEWEIPFVSTSQLICPARTPFLPEEE